METEVSAGWIVRFCQHRRQGWQPFTYADIEAFYNAAGKLNFRFNSLLSQGYIMRYADSINGDSYVITHEFVAKCFESSPAIGVTEAPQVGVTTTS